MKYLFKEKRKFIVIIVLLLIICLWFLWADEFIKYKTPGDYANKLNLFYTNEIIAQNNEYAVCLARSNLNSKPDKIIILEKNKPGDWKLLTNKLDYKEKCYIPRILSRGFTEIFIIHIKNKIIISVMQISSSESNLSLNEVSDSQNTEFYKSSTQNKSITPLYVSITGFIENLDEENYVLYINDNEYLYRDWGKLFRRF